ncbi:MAG: tyrosine-type recombinase/integrase [Planctomycetota bacterium]
MASIIRRKYKAKDKTGKTVQRQSPYWYIDYKTAEGTRKRIKGFKDKAGTAQLAAKLEREAELAQAGVVDKYAKHRSRPLAEHLADFKTSLLSKGTTGGHAQLTSNRIRAILEGCRFTLMADISASKTLKYLAERRHNGLSVKSSNDYLQAVKQLCRWLVADRRMADNPLAYLSGLNAKIDRRHDRRALSAEELTRLIDTTDKSRTHHKMTGRERALLYLLVANTGLRAGEAASLTWRSFDLDNPAPTVTVLAAFSKHRRQDVLPLRSDVAGQFRWWRSERNEPPEARVFPKFNRRKAADMLKIDLEAAQIPYKDAAGRYADFHALRHSFISSLDHPDISVKVAQSLARHSSVTLTLDTYTHPKLYSERAALEKLPKLPDVGTDTGGRSAAVAVKTGTDDSPAAGEESVYKPVYKKLAKNAYSDKTCLSSAGTSKDEEGGIQVESSDGDNVLSAVSLGADCDAVSPSDIPVQVGRVGFEPT